MTLVKDPNTRTPLSLRTPRQTPSAHRPAIALALGAALAAPATFAADAPADAPLHTTQLEEIDVEADAPPDANPYADPAAPYKVDRLQGNKFSQPVLDISKSITAIPKEVIEDSGATSLKEIMRIQPGVTIGTGEGGNAFGDRFIIRGFEARSDLFIDGLRDPGVIARETFAIEQVEIARGPSSTFAGRGTTGAAVNLVSKTPTDRAFGSVELSAGTDSFRRATFDVNQPIGEALAVRVNGLVHDAGVGGRDEVFDERAGGALAIAAEPFDGGRFVFDWYYLDVDALPDWGVPWDAANNRPFEVDRESFYGLTTRDFWDVQANVATLRFDWRIPDGLSLSSSTRYGETGNAYVASAPEAPNAVARTVQARAKTRNQTNEAFVHQTSLAATLQTGGFTHELVGGVEYSREDTDNTPFIVTPSAVVQPLDDPDPTNWVGTITRSGSTATRDVETRSLYLLDTVILSQRWEAFAGVRWDDWKIDAATIVNEYVNAASVLANDADFVNGHAGIVYKPRPNQSWYLALSTSSNPSGELVDGGGADYGSITAGNQNLDPERNRNLELGAKWAVADNHLLLTAALFRTEKSNARVTTGAGSTAVTNLEGEQRVDGLELGVAGNPHPRLSLFGGFTWLDTEVVSSPVATQVGQALPNVAERSFSLQARWQWTERLAVGATAIHASEINGGTVVATQTEIPSFWRGDLFAEYDVNDNLSLRLNVLNATDEVYYDTLYRSATPFVYIAPGRSAFATLEYRY
jgi:catecholate siderophore receptor